MRGRRDKHRLVVEERRKLDTLQVLGVGGDHQIHLLPLQCGQGVEAQAGTDVHVNLGPCFPELLQDRKKPLETGVTLDGNMQPTAFARS